MARTDTGFHLEKLDDFFFTSQNERENGRIGEMKHIDLSLIDNFPNHPYLVIDDDKMYSLAEEIKESEVHTPALVRQKDDGRYELISGHRRKRASEIAGKTTLPCIVVECDEDKAVMMMVDCNNQRETILPSEKARAYKMRLDAMKHQGKVTSVPLAQKSKTSREQLGEMVGESQDQIRRYIRLNYLVAELLQLVDDKKMGMRPAVELSYISEDLQRELVETIDAEQCTPSHAQTIKMRKFFDEGKLSVEVIESIMQEEKPNQKEHLSISADAVRKFIPKTIPKSKTEDFIVKAVEHYAKYLRNREMDR